MRSERRKLGRWSVVGATLAIAWAVPRVVYGVARAWRRTVVEQAQRERAQS